MAEQEPQYIKSGTIFLSTDHQGKHIAGIVSERIGNTIVTIQGSIPKNPFFHRPRSFPPISQNRRHNPRFHQLRLINHSSLNFLSLHCSENLNGHPAYAGMTV